MAVENPLTVIRESFTATVNSLYGIDVKPDLFSLEQTPNPAMGDLGIGCFPLSKIVRKSPKDIASEFVEKCDNLPFTKEVKAVGPFVNVIIDAGKFLEGLSARIADRGDNYGKTGTFAGEKVMVEYSAPNTNKPQHLGHVRNNVLGMALSNIMEAAGYDVARVNLVNDRGIHICKSMLAYKKWGEGVEPADKGIKGDHFVGDYYIMYEKKVKEKPHLAEQAVELLQLWEQGDEEVIGLWKKMNRWVLDGFYETYDRLGCKFDKYYFESETYKLGKEKVLKALDEGLLKRSNSGDIIIELEGFDTDRKVLLRKDGTSVYITQDIGTTILKFNDFKLDRSIFVVASEQNLHFKLLFHILKELGYEWADRCYHLSYGMVYLPEGKMKSREGKVVDADDLMDELHRMAKEEVQSRSRDVEEGELEHISESVGLSALKYFILKVNPNKDIHFSPEESLAFEGATGPYAQYSCARLSSILRKGGEKLDGTPDFSLLGNEEERKLAMNIANFPNVIVDAAKSMNPARITTYIFELSKAINKFHYNHPVLKAGSDDLMLARGGLIKMAKQTLANSLTLLGITPLERM